MSKHQILFFVFLISLISACSDKNNNIPIDPIFEPELVFSNNIEVGLQPAGVYFDPASNVFHVFCMGIDKNYDGIKDADDASPSWWVIDKDDTENATKKLEFDFGFLGLPFRPAYDIDGRQLIISQNGKIRRYSLDDFSLIEDIDGYYADALTIHGDYLFISQNLKYDEVGELIVYNYKTKTEVTRTNCGFYTKQTIYYENNNKKFLAVVSEGLNNNDAMIQFYEFSDNQLELVKEFSGLGNYGNHIVINNHFLAYTMNGSHLVYIFDLDNMTLANSFDTKTTGFNGPREAVFFDQNQLIVTTYNNDIRIFDYVSGNLLRTLQMDSKTEGLCYLSEHYLMVCNNLFDYSNPNNIISVFNIKYNPKI